MIPLGILAAAGGAVASVGSYDLLSTTILTTNTASVTFASLGTYAADYQHLQVRATCRTMGGFTQDDIVFTINADSAANYSHHLVVGNGASVSSFAGTNQNFIKSLSYSTGSTSPTGAFGSGVLDILDPFNTSKYTTTRTLTGKTAGEIQLWSGNWRSTASITSLNFFAISGSNLALGTRISLYGLRKV